MTTEQFCYWVQGFLEIQDPKNITEEQVKIIKDHLNLVFTKLTPPYKITKITFPETTPPLEPTTTPWIVPYDDKTVPLWPTWKPYEIICSSKFPEKNIVE